MVHPGRVDACRTDASGYSRGFGCSHRCCGALTASDFRGKRISLQPLGSSVIESRAARRLERIHTLAGNGRIWKILEGNDSSVIIGAVIYSLLRRSDTTYSATGCYHCFILTSDGAYHPAVPLCPVGPGMPSGVTACV